LSGRRSTSELLGYRPKAEPIEAEDEEAELAESS
jgi:hypothetical protein